MSADRIPIVQLKALGIPILEHWTSDGKAVIRVEPARFSVDVGSLARLLSEHGCTDIRMEFEPAQVWESCSNEEEIRIVWTIGEGA